MELREYGRILGRRWWLIVGLVVLVAVLTLATKPDRPTMYQATMAFTVGIKAQQVPPDVYAYDRYYTWLTAEYLVDDLAEVVRRGEFAKAVGERMASQGTQMAPGAISASTQAGKLHRILTVTIQWRDEKQLESMANATAWVLEQNSAQFFGYLDTGSAVANLVDGPTYGPVGLSLRERLDLPLRLILALLAGIALAFLWHYLDPLVRTREDVDRLGISVIVEVPKRPWWRRGPPHQTS